MTLCRLSSAVFDVRYRADRLDGLVLVDCFAGHGRAAAAPASSWSAAEFLACCHPDDRALLAAALPYTLRERGESEFTYRMVEDGGGIRWFRAWERVRELADTELRSERFVTDVTSEVTATQAQQESERLYRDLVTLTAVGVAKVDGAGRCTYVNDRLLEMAGLGGDEFLALNWHGVAHPEDAGRLRAEWSAAAEAGRPYRGEYRVVCRHDGSSRWVLGQAMPHQDAAGAVAGWVVTVTDISDRHRREEMERQLSHALKMEALGQLAGSVAHDFNNLLGAVLGFAQFIAEDSPAGSSSRYHAERILAAGERGKRLVEQILSFARREDCAREDFPIAELVREVQALLAVGMPSSASMTISEGDGGAIVNGDRHRLGQVLINLCINARDALEGHGGEVGVSLRPTRSQGQTFARLARRADGCVPDIADIWSDGEANYAIVGVFDPHVEHVSLSVSDSGCGIALGVMEHIFKPFFTTKERGKGTGLGLPMVSGAVLAHGGAIVVESRVHHGTTFEIVLPVAAPASAGESAASAVALARPAGARLLVVDNDLGFGEMLGYGLKRRGFHVAAHSDPRTALAALRTQPHAWDGVVTDLVMAEMSGLDLVREARALRRDLPCLICTGYAEDLVDMGKLAEMGVFALLRKTAEVGEIVGTIAQAVRG